MGCRYTNCSNGTVSDSDGGVGTYEFNDDTVDFTLVFPDVTYEYSNGDFTDENTMNGNCKRYQDAAAAIKPAPGPRPGSGAAAVAPGATSGAKGKSHRTK